MCVDLSGERNAHPLCVSRLYWLSLFEVSEDLRQWCGESRQQLGLFKGVAEPGASDFGFELVDRIVVGLPSVGIEDEHGLGSGGDVLWDTFRSRSSARSFRETISITRSGAKGKGPCEGRFLAAIRHGRSRHRAGGLFRQPRGQSEAKRV